MRFVFKIFLPSVICVFFISVVELSLEYYPIIFGGVIGIVNWKCHKKEPIVGIIISILLSVFSFYFTILIMYLLRSLSDFLIVENGSSIYIIKIMIKSIAPFMFSPLLVFYSYKFLFSFPKTKLTGVIMAIAILSLFFYNVYIEYNDYRVFDHKISNPYSLWLIIMTLVIQLIIYQKSLLKFKL